MCVEQTLKNEIDYAIINFHFLGNDKARFVPEQCFTEGKGVIICYNLSGNRKEINFLLKDPFSQSEELQVWEGEEEVIDSASKKQIGNMIRERRQELIFHGMGELA